ncbi:LacI family DNA-binding transcriptional regulator [Humibacter sp.]|uniref:LacI family DNA-binding transcriptional regulator n=1 Tax=Humibacter sp. TaxID=1940291 RepID=UPI003F80F13E
MAVTRSDVARAAGVSPAVVSYVLNGGPRPVSAAARSRVEAAIEELDYRPNAIASALRGGSTHSVGLLSPDPLDPYFAELSEAMEREFSSAGYVVLTGHTRGDRSREERYVRTFVARQVDGLIFASGAAGSLEGLECPVLVIDGHSLPDSISSISIEQPADAAVAVEHLQRHGHSLIGCISRPVAVAASGSSIDGWRTQQSMVGAPVGDELVAFAETSEEGGNLAAHMLLSEHGRPWAIHGTRPTALFVGADVQAIGAIHACWELGLRVPEDVAIVSIGGTRPAAFTVPPLTTIRQDLPYVASRAVLELRERFEDPSRAPKHSRMRGNLVVGRSCGCNLV